MSEDKHKLSNILYYSDIHPADTEFINNIIYDLQQENKQLKKKYENAVSDYEQEHYKVVKAIEYIDKHKIEWVDKKFEKHNVMVKFNEYSNPQALLEILGGDSDGM